MLHPIVDQSYHDCVTRGNKSCTIVLCIRNLRTKKNCCCNSITSTIHWIEKKKICSVCTTCFCSGCGFGRVDAFLIQGYLRETYLPIGGPKLYKLKGSKTLVVSLQHWLLLDLRTIAWSSNNSLKTFFKCDPPYNFLSKHDQWSSPGVFFKKSCLTRSHLVWSHNPIIH